MQRAAADELSRLEIEDFHSPARTEPALETDDINAQQHLYRDIAEHAWQHLEHRGDLTDAGVRNAPEAAQLISEIAQRAGNRDWWNRSEPGRDAEAVFDGRTGPILIINGPDSSEPGTIFKPDGDAANYLRRDGFVRRR